jgi:maltose alpha-D-glucosyltransferase/alpha-amylase
MSDRLWYKNAVLYQVYIRAFFDSNADGHGDIHGLTEKLDYLKDLGVDCLWLMPFYPSPLKDDGYDIADFCSVHPDYGSLDDFKSLLDAAHARGIRIITDLVLNHTSDQHPWFQAARMDRHSPYRDYYVWSDTPDKYGEARIIFLDTEKSNWTWDETAGQYFWHRFYSSQPDLNYESPAVRREITQVIRFWLDLGVDGFRVDAVPYLFERENTNCENLPETHTYLKELRTFIDAQYPGRILLCEANQWPADLRAYMGEGDEFQMAFHFPIMPRIFMALGRHERAPLEWVIENTPPIPANCQWCIFLRNHDELTLEMVTPAERNWLWDTYAPEPRMRLNLGIRRRLAPLLDNDRRRILLANSLLFTLPGSPIIYYGDEIGMGDNIWLSDRNGVRTPLQWDTSANAGFSTAAPGKLYTPPIDAPPYGPAEVNINRARADAGSLWHVLQRMIAVRKAQPALGDGQFTWIPCDDPAIAAYARGAAGEQVWAIHNLADTSREIGLPSALPMTDLFDQKVHSPTDGRITFRLEPYGYHWLRAK